jgi:hypothetical protein
VQSSEFSVEEKSAGGPQESQAPGAKTAPGAPTAKRARKEEERTHPFIPQNRRDGAEERKPQRVGHPAEAWTSFTSGAKAHLAGHSLARLKSCPPARV